MHISVYGNSKSFFQQHVKEDLKVVSHASRLADGVCAPSGVDVFPPRSLVWCHFPLSVAFSAHTHSVKGRNRHAHLHLTEVCHEIVKRHPTIHLKPSHSILLFYVYRAFVLKLSYHCICTDISRWSSSSPSFSSSSIYVEVCWPILNRLPRLGYLHWLPLSTRINNINSIV